MFTCQFLIKGCAVGVRVFRPPSNTFEMRNSYLPHSSLVLTIYKGAGRLKIKDLMSDLVR